MASSAPPLAGLGAPESRAAADDDAGRLAAALGGLALSPNAAADAPPPPALTLEDVAPYVAQAGHRGAADVLARLTRHLRSEKRIWRAISRLALGLYRRTRLAAAARCGDVARCAFLLAHGADARAVDRFGRSALDEAVAGVTPRPRPCCAPRVPWTRRRSGAQRARRGGPR